MFFLILDEEFTLRHCENMPFERFNPLTSEIPKSLREVVILGQSLHLVDLTFTLSALGAGYLDLLFHCSEKN